MLRCSFIEILVQGILKGDHSEDESLFELLTFYLTSSGSFNDKIKNCQANLVMTRGVPNPPLKGLFVDLMGEEQVSTQVEEDQFSKKTS